MLEISIYYKNAINGWLYIWIYYSILFCILLLTKITEKINFKLVLNDPVNWCFIFIYFIRYRVSENKTEILVFPKIMGFNSKCIYECVLFLFILL